MFKIEAYFNIRWDSKFSTASFHLNVHYSRNFNDRSSKTWRAKGDLNRNTIVDLLKNFDFFEDWVSRVIECNDCAVNKLTNTRLRNETICRIPKVQIPMPKKSVRTIKKFCKNTAIERLYRFFGHWDSDLWKSAYSFIPQSSV